MEESAGTRGTPASPEELVVMGRLKEKMSPTRGWWSKPLVLEGRGEGERWSLT